MLVQYALKRVLLLFPTLIFVSIVIFGMLHLVPGDPAVVIAGPDAHQEDLIRIRERLGLDQPLHVQYLTWIRGVFTGDLGTSIRTGLEIGPRVMNRFANTLQLAVAGGLLATVVGVLIGVISAVKARTALDYAAMSVALIGISVPSFAVGLTLMVVFAVWLGWLPTSGTGTWRHFILPTITIASFSTALIARITRSAVLEVLNMDYVTTARAKGLREQLVVFKHALKNAMLPVVTVIGLEFGTLLSGSVITETVFHWPGLGRFLVEGLFQRDFPVVQASVLVIAATFVLLNLLVDLTYGLLDPRVRYG